MLGLRNIAETTSLQAVHPTGTLATAGLCLPRSPGCLTSRQYAAELSHSEQCASMQEHLFGPECPGRTFQQFWTYRTSAKEEIGKDPEGDALLQQHSKGLTFQHFVV